MKLLLCLFGVSLSLLVIEVGWRAASSSIEVQWSDRPDSYFRPPGSKHFQDYAYSLQKPPGIFRIAIVGDSFSYGPFLQIDDTFPKKLERILRMNRNRMPVEVLNLGVPGHSMWHHMAGVKSALQYSPDLLLLQITLNDVAVDPLRSLQNDPEFDFRPFSPGRELSTLLQYWRSLGYLLRRVHSTKMNQLHTKYYQGIFSDQKRYQVFENSLKQIAQSSNKAETPLIAVVFPLFGPRLDDSYPFHQIHLKIQKSLKSLSIPSLDLFEHYKFIPSDRLQVKPGKDTHPNEIAHRIAAEMIFKWLSSSGFLPDSLHVRKMPQRRY